MKIKAKIIGIKKRNIFARFLSINYWKVYVECEDRIYTINAWAGMRTPRYSYLEHDVEKELRRQFRFDKPKIKIEWVK